MPKYVIAFVIAVLAIGGIAALVLYRKHLGERDDQARSPVQKSERSASKGGGDANSSILFLNDGNFDAVVSAHKGLMVVDFSATWCPPCRKLAPIVDQFAEDYKGRVHTGKVDVDESPELAKRFEVSGIPHLVLMRDGKVLSTKTGWLPKEDLQAWVEGVLTK